MHVIKRLTVNYDPPCLCIVTAIAAEHICVSLLGEREYESSLL